MKRRNGFVSNSSSSSFIIKNLTNREMTLKDFAEETSYLVEDFNDLYDWNNDSIDDFFKDVNDYDYEWTPKEDKIVSFGDEDGNVMGKVYDYMLRDGGESESFQWWFHEARR